MNEGSTGVPGAPGPASHREAAELAAQHGLRKLGARPALRTYARNLIRRRHFIWFLASSDAYGRNQGSYLGQLWAILNPSLQFAVFWLVFGVIMGTDKGIEDFISYLAVGTFLFGFMSSGLTQGSKAISGRTQLVRALEFPRAVLPLSVTMAELIIVWPALLVMLGIEIIRGQTITWQWLGVIPAVAMMYLFTTGCGFILARVCSITPDFVNLVPIATSMLRFMSGVFYVVPAPGELPGVPDFLLVALHEQPFAIYLELVRGCTMAEFSNDWTTWALGAGWAVLSGIAGFIYFWRAEARYGRD